MMSKFPLTRTVLVARRSSTGKSRFNDATVSFAAPVEQKVFGWASPTIEEQVTAEHAGRVIWDVTLLAPSGAIELTDQVIIDSDRFEVTHIGNFDNGPVGWLEPGLESIQLKLVKG
ncbi:hypothetical protein [Corynebacterium ulceribovis]|uniref:hypothetical protein n=1 Tax=Corynebacterium ulceribovis TaxID=487732 RepID=UPI0003661CF6|nr:hypothetical protein [Corynebacterium ulceribovis]